jgi:hypothetical protein
LGAVGPTAKGAIVLGETRKAKRPARPAVLFSFGSSGSDWPGPCTAIADTGDRSGPTATTADAASCHMAKIIERQDFDRLRLRLLPIVAQLHIASLVDFLGTPLAATASPDVKSSTISPDEGRLSGISAFGVSHPPQTGK